MRRCSGVGLSNVARWSQPGVRIRDDEVRRTMFLGRWLLAIFFLAKPPSTDASENLPDLIERIDPLDRTHSNGRHTPMNWKECQL